MERQKQGRPMASDRVRITPEFRKNPDIEKLGRALIAVAIQIAQKKKAEEQAAQQEPSEGSKGDGMT